MRSSALLSVAFGMLLCLPLLILFAECVAAVWQRRPHRQAVKRGGADPRGSLPVITVLVSAHDEESVIGPMIESVRPQLRRGDEILVVADNCSDNTAAVARRLGARVLVRDDSSGRSKGFGLDFGLRDLARQPPGMVIVLDADCTAGVGAIEALARHAVDTGRPVQAAYTMVVESDAAVHERISAFAFTMRNLVRPLGLARLGGPCPLFGSGMAFPWEVLRGISLANRHLAEDLTLAVDLAVAGHLPSFCNRAVITSRLPMTLPASLVQRRRWEQGHLVALATQGPRLVIAALRQRRPALLVLLVDLAVPPLSLMVVLWSVGLVIGIAVATLGRSIWLVGLLGAAGGLLAVALLAAWICFGKNLLPLAGLLGVPAYVGRKLQIYAELLWRRDTKWIKTPRTPARKRPSGDVGPKGAP